MPLIYVVDDDPGTLNSLRFLLEIEGYQVSPFLDGQELHDHVNDETPACIIIDYKLPRTDAVEIYRKLRSSLRDIPVIVITGHPDPAIRRRVAAAGLPLIEKPLSQDSLLRAVRAACEWNSRL